MAVKTRSMTRRRMPSSGAKRSYRRRVRASKCRGKKGYSCAAAPGCKMSKGKKRRFCRKSKNTRRQRR